MNLTVFKFQCPNCQQPYEAEANIEGEVLCEKCNFSFVPSSEEFVRAKQPEESAEVEAKPMPSTGQRAIDMCSDPALRQLFIITTTSNEVSGQAIEKYLGIARGVVVRSPTSTQSLFGGLEKILGGNIEAYGKLCEQARQDAFARMVDHANTMKADAIIAFRYDATEFSPGVTEVLAYGTAVKLRQV